MKVYQSPQTGYLVIEDISEGIEIMSTSSYLALTKYIDELEKGCERVDIKIELLEEQLRVERTRNDQLLVAIGVLYDRLETVKNAHYIEGFADGAWQCQHRELNDVGKQLQSDVASFPKLLESALSDIKSIISKN